MPTSPEHSLLALLVDLDLQRPDSAIQIRQGLGPLLALVEAFVVDGAPFVAGSNLTITDLTLLVMAAHSSACAAAAAKPNAAARVAARIVLVMVVMVSPALKSKDKFCNQTRWKI